MRQYCNLTTSRGYWIARGSRLLWRGLPPAAVVLATTLLILGLQAWELRRLATQRDSWQQQADQVARLREKVSRLHREREELQQKVQAVGSVSRGLPPAWLLALLGEAVDAAHRNVLVREVQFTEGPDGPSFYAINVRGWARGHADVASFVARLRLDPATRHIEIERVAARPDEQLVEFTVSFAVGKQRREER